MGFFQNNNIDIESFFTPKSKTLRGAAVCKNQTPEEFKDFVDNFIKHKSGRDEGLFVLNVKRGEIYFEGKIFKYSHHI